MLVLPLLKDVGLYVHFNHKASSYYVAQVERPLLKLLSFLDER